MVHPNKVEIFCFLLIRSSKKIVNGSIININKNELIRDFTIVPIDGKLNPFPIIGKTINNTVK